MTTNTATPNPASIELARLKFLSTYRGEANYEVLDGPVAGSRVRVKFMPVDFYRLDWDGGKPWNMTEPVYMRDIVGAAGIVNIAGRAVPEAVLLAVDAEFTMNRAQMPDRTYGTFCTGEWSAEAGWTRSEFDANGVRTGPRPDETQAAERMRA